MQTCTTIKAIRQIISACKLDRQRIALVPTMGNLHAGHMALVEEARALADLVVVSIFVNPMQFNETADFRGYPRTLEEDTRQLAAAGVDVLFAPTGDEMYPHGQDAITRVMVPDLDRLLEGAFRPGHFTGVATVVSKLFNIVQPDVAVFGEKDFQQLMLIRRMVQDLDMPIDIVAVATLREADGLAMSSRNGLLDEEQRQRAPVLYASLEQLVQRLQKGEMDTSRLEAEAMENLVNQGFEPEYVAIRRSSDLESPQAADRELVVLAAARLGSIRLIDNIPLVLNLNP